MEINNLDHAVSTNIKSSKVNGAINNEPYFDSINILSNNLVQDPVLIVTVILEGGKNLDIP